VYSQLYGRKLCPFGRYWAMRVMRHAKIRRLVANSCEKLGMVGKNGIDLDLAESLQGPAVLGFRSPYNILVGLAFLPQP